MWRVLRHIQLCLSFDFARARASVILPLTNYSYRLLLTSYIYVSNYRFTHIVIVSVLLGRKITCTSIEIYLSSLDINHIMKFHDFFDFI